MFARNARDLAEETGSEFTGATFSADGQTLFVNLQISRPSRSRSPARGRDAPASSTPTARRRHLAA